MKKEWPFCLLREAKWGVASMPMGTDVALVIGSPSEEALVYMPVSFASFTGISTSFSNETNLCIVESHRILLRCWLLYGRISDTGPFHPLMNYKACGVLFYPLGNVRSHFISDRKIGSLVKNGTQIPSF